MKLAPRCQLVFERQQQQKQLLQNPGKTWPVPETRTNKEELEEEEKGGWRKGWWWWWWWGFTGRVDNLESV